MPHATTENANDIILRRRNYAVHLRRTSVNLASAAGSNPVWHGAPQPSHQVIFLLEGSWLWRVENNSNHEATHTPCALFVAPHTQAEARFVDETRLMNEARTMNNDSSRRNQSSNLVASLPHASLSRASLLALTLSPSTLLDTGVRARLVRDDAAIDFRVTHIEQDEKLFRLAEELKLELTTNQEAVELVADALIEQIVVHLLRRYTAFRRTHDLELSRVGLVDRRIRRAIELMHASLERELTNEQLAAAAYLSPFHFARLFKKLTGTTPHAYLASLRIAAAQDLLTDTDLSITEIAVRVGFQNSSHFAKAFRYATNLSPRDYRAKSISINRDK